MPDFIQFFLFLGFTGLMFLLRLDARRFGAAEWDTEEGDWRTWASRLSWYLAGLALALLVYALHPQPVSELNLAFAPDSGEALFMGLLFGLGGTAVAFGLALLRSGRLRFPRPGRYPGAVLSSLGTAFFDEFLFRGVLLGLLLGLGLPDWTAVVAMAIIYAGAVRATSGGRGLMLLVSLAIGLVGGFLVLETAGIAAGLVGHTITRFVLFLTMGHPGRAVVQAQLRTETQLYALPPTGWARAGDEDDGRGGPGPVRRG
ncbi:hypothetical protein BH23CHL8_BH23CHL8_15510 [soil metagenome]